MTISTRSNTAPPVRRLVRLRVTDARHAKDARWRAQKVVARAAGWQACRGFTDLSVRRGRQQVFWVRPALIPRFLRDVAPLVMTGRVSVSIDGRIVRAVRR